jgi:SAM-dependent methyltransferase
MLKELLTHRSTRGLDIDAPETTMLRRQIIQEKSLLRRIYLEWYSILADATSELEILDGPILEIGSGCGFLGEHISSLIASDILPIENIDVVLDGNQLPFSRNSLGGIVMVNVIHHLNHVQVFLWEAARCVRPKGMLVMIEPWVTPWSRFVYSRFHHEDFIPDSESWEFKSSGPLSGANGALPWIIFQRDREKFLAEYPEWRIHEITPIMPIRYLLSGGVSFRSLTPSWLCPFWGWVEARLSPWNKHLAMFAVIVLKRVN